MADPYIITSTTLRYIPGQADGIVLGFNAADLVGFYGTTPVAQQTFTPTAVTAVTTVAFSAAYTGIWGFQSSTAAKLLRTRINQLVVDMAALNTKLAALGILA